MLKFEDFKMSRARPGLEEADLTQLDYKTLSELEQMTLKEIKEGSFYIVCDDVKWAAYSTDDKGVKKLYSSDGIRVWFVPDKRTRFLAYDLNGNKMLLALNSDIKVNAEKIDKLYVEKEEEINMENRDVLNDLMAEATMNVSNAQTSQIQGMNSFEGDLSFQGENMEETNNIGVEKISERDTIPRLIKKIKEDMKGSLKEVDMSEIIASWKKNARLICFVTPTDKRQTLAAVKLPVKPENRELADGATPEIEAMFNKNKGSVPPEFIKSEYEIRARECKPGKPVGVIAKIPFALKGCSIYDYTKNISLEGIKKYEDATAIEMFTMNDFEQKLMLVGSSIQEAEETVMPGTKPGEIKIVVSYPKTVAITKDGTLKSDGLTFATKIMKDGNGTRTPLHDKNYFPLVTYETVDIYKEIPEDLVADLNLYTFGSLFSPSKNSKQVAEKYKSLKTNDKLHIKVENEEILSDYITNDANRRVMLTLRPFYDKTIERETISLPLKTKAVKADGSQGSPAFIKFNATTEEKMKNSDYLKNSSLGNGKFDDIINLVGTDILNPSSLRTAFKRSGTKSISKHVEVGLVSNLIRAKSMGELQNYSLGNYTFN